MHLLANILMKLNIMDLINMSKVSRIWKKILENSKGAVQLYSKTMQTVIESSKLSLHATTRGYVVDFCSKVIDLGTSQKRCSSQVLQSAWSERFYLQPARQVCGGGKDTEE